ncbi:MAG: universal stress protein [Proteocatella sp.]
MFSKIILASEPSKGAMDVVRCMKDLKKFGAKKCLVLQCFNQEDINATISLFILNLYEENLRKQKEILLEQGYEVETRLISGPLRKEINRIALEEGYSVIVAESDSHSLLGEAVFGGVASEVIHHATKPVLLIRTPEHAQEDPSSLSECELTGHVLFPTDFSDNARTAFEYVKKMAAEGLKKVTILHVQDQSLVDPHFLKSMEEFNDTDFSKLMELKKELQEAADVEVDAQLIYGSPYVEITRLVDEQEIPLVVMGSQGRGFIKELYLGSLSHNIARNSSASVLLVPANR